jgi:hypothetical protein
MDGIRQTRDNTAQAEGLCIPRCERIHKQMASFRYFGKMIGFRELNLAVLDRAFLRGFHG